jgi:23S rRNA pseudouridine1911/1915/1917 synthase
MTRFVVPPSEPTRLDRFVAEQLGGRSRQATRELIAAAAVRVNGRVARKGQLVHPGDIVDIDTGTLTPAPLAPQPELPLSVLLADGALIVIDKPAGMPTVALHASDRGTLANALLARFPELREASPDPLEAGLVHRLDTATSGVVVAARTAPAWRALREQFRAGDVAKRYLALVAGSVREAGTVRLPIAHRPRRPREMCVCANPEQARALGARPALTRFRPLRAGRAVTLVEVDIDTGVRHQIRVHLASIGHAIVGDPLYARAAVADVARLMLHASRLGLRHPVTGTAVEIVSPEPEDFTAELRRFWVRPRRC